MGTERWDRDRVYERDRFEDDKYYMRGGRGREQSEDRYDRRRFYEDDFVRDRRYHDDDLRYEPRREPARHPEIDRRVVMEKERDRDYYRDNSPRRPAFLRRQSSLDTYDRRPIRHVLDQREEYPPPARREDIFRDEYRAPAYTPIPIPRARGLPPPGRRDDRYYDDYRPESEYHPDDDYRHMPERIREREVIREREKRDRSRESKATRSHTHRSSSRSSSSSSSSAGGATLRSEYPKKGKTKIPARLVSKRALIDLGYPYVEEDTTIIVQKALGQENIDVLLKLSEEYIKVDQEVIAARSSAGDIIEERRKETFVEAPIPPPPPPVAIPAPPPAPIVVPPPAPAPAPVIVEAGPRGSGHIDVVDRTVIRESSPSRSSSSWDSGHHHHHRHHHHHEDGALVVVPRSRSRSRSRREIRAEIKALERELVHRPRGEVEREVVRTERLPDGQLVVYEEEVERTVAHPKPPRIEKDKKGPPPALMRAMLGTLT
ncbi:hypothetical protein VFPPC_01290 [Pochonia chlamydosporia 170]|uniref:DUF8035 domain-containing protein n=1 Tax=Pochonia chlamydosporia 170 TaxID=1380566 RepID=A0A179G889_METCM|nr:hypothetical protein VFPPC_01290 [Pochonia chlamydosporia 170]OAQ73613.1 hypothetical protein VFPPC_01290 [Pochonia chlamydosporia 170]